MKKYLSYLIIAVLCVSNFSNVAFSASPQSENINIDTDEQLNNEFFTSPEILNLIDEHDKNINTNSLDDETAQDKLLNHNHLLDEFTEHELVEKFSNSEEIVNSLLNNTQLVENLLNNSQINQEIKDNLQVEYEDYLIEDLSYNYSKNVQANVSELTSNGVQVDILIDTDTYESEINLVASLDGSDMQIYSKLEAEDDYQITNYEVIIQENTEENFKAYLYDTKTGEKIHLSEENAHASAVVGVVVRIVGGAIKFFSKKTGKEVTKTAAKNATKSFSSGQAGEKYLETLVKVAGTQVYKKTTLGGRYIDVLDKSGIAHESKVGYVSLTSSIKKQIDKDYELVKSSNHKDIKGAKWHFFRSNTTGKVGASKQVLDYLTKKGIPYKIHDK